MATKEEEISHIALEELRRKYDEICSANDQLRIKVLAFITGELALATFLFATGIDIPTVIYGIIFFLFGVTCVGTSFILLVLTLKGVTWITPVGVKALRDGHKDSSSKLEYLNEVKNSYLGCIKDGATIVNARAKSFDIALMLLLAGVIILLVIKYGQGEILWQNLIKR